MESSINLYAELSNIKKSISETNEAVSLSQTAVVNTIMHSMSVIRESQSNLMKRPPSGLELCEGPEKTIIDNYMSEDQHALVSTRDVHLSRERFKPAPKCVPILRDHTGTEYVSSGPSLSPMPMTLLETSRNYYPETYTLESRIPRSCLVVISSYEQSSCADYKTNVYTLLSLISPREWRRLTASITIPHSSKYWVATRTTQGQYRRWQNPVLVGAAQLPYSLVTSIQTFFCQGGAFEHNTRICLSLSDKEAIQWQPQRFIDASSTIPEAYSPSSDALNFLSDLGCPRYIEDEVTQIEIVDPPNRFASCISGMLVYEYKITDPIPSLEMLYNIRVLHCMNGTPGFAKLVGIVTDKSGKHLKSYLIEFPKSRWNVAQMVGNPNVPVPWERRAKWAVQLVTGIIRLHAKGFVVGGLTLWCIPVIIDSTVSVRFWSFKKKFVPGRIVGAYYPPEFRYVRNMSPTKKDTETPNVTSKTDIFHLGLLLWLLAENKHQTRHNPVCMKRGCNTGMQSCDLSHTEPIALPPLPEGTPRYYSDIVDACRAENPSDRPTASDIIKMFPSSSNSEYSLPVLDNVDVLGGGLRIGRVNCGYCCEKNIQPPYFHCNVCELGDFDICQRCYIDGKHCYHADHLLVELVNEGSWTVPKRYHSSVKGSRTRDILDL